MLVIISDLHLTDGSSGETIRERAFRIFRQELNDLAYEASWRAIANPQPDGPTAVYAPIKEVDIILLGDILDVIRSVEWLNVDPGIRPWMPLPSAGFEQLVARITDGIIANNAVSLGILRDITEPQHFTLPPAVDGKPGRVTHEIAAAERVPVTVRIHYMVGNHDWFYHLPGPAYDAIRAKVVSAIGLANDPSAPFPHDPKESPAITKTLADHAVFARHGDIYDPSNYEGNRDASSLGDAIVIELLNRFPQQVVAQLGPQLKPEFKAGLKELDNVRPLLSIPLWIENLVQRTCDEATGRAVKQIWDRLAEQFSAHPFIRGKPWTTRLRIRLALNLSAGFSFARLARLSGTVQGWLRGDESYARNVLREETFLARTACRFVYGHTHHYEAVPLATTAREGTALAQLYFNSGTWRQVHEREISDTTAGGFQGYKVMTYIAFFRGDERGGAVFEAWNGAIG
jgi:UDP-2,3-diacylglucosamine pyrophosphatase LpxH